MRRRAPRANAQLPLGSGELNAQEDIHLLLELPDLAGAHSPGVDLSYRGVGVEGQAEAQRGATATQGPKSPPELLRNRTHKFISQTREDQGPGGLRGQRGALRTICPFHEWALREDPVGSRRPGQAVHPLTAASSGGAATGTRGGRPRPQPKAVGLEGRAGPAQPGAPPELRGGTRLAAGAPHAPSQRPRALSHGHAPRAQNFPATPRPLRAPRRRPLHRRRAARGSVRPKRLRPAPPRRGPRPDRAGRGGGVPGAPALRQVGALSRAGVRPGRAPPPELGRAIPMMPSHGHGFRSAAAAATARLMSGPRSTAQTHFLEQLGGLRRDWKDGGPPVLKSCLSKSKRDSGEGPWKKPPSVLGSTAERTKQEGPGSQDTALAFRAKESVSSSEVRAEGPTALGTGGPARPEVLCRREPAPVPGMCTRSQRARGVPHLADGLRGTESAGAQGAAGLFSQGGKGLPAVPARGDPVPPRSTSGSVSAKGLPVSRRNVYVHKDQSPRGAEPAAKSAFGQLPSCATVGTEAGGARGTFHMGCGSPSFLTPSPGAERDTGAQADRALPWSDFAHQSRLPSPGRSFL
ncbi:hypothetical protein H8959_012776 [Pygathrix nigripes]